MPGTKWLFLVSLILIFFVSGGVNLLAQSPLEQAPPTMEEGSYEYQEVVVGYRKVCKGSYCVNEPIVKRVLMRASNVVKSSTVSLAKAVDKVVPTELIRANGPSWTYPGNIYDHLRNGHGVSPEGMSLREAEDYHSSLHNAERASVSFSSSCPGGVCPTNGTRTRRWRR